MRKYLKSFPCQVLTPPHNPYIVIRSIYRRGMTMDPMDIQKIAGGAASGFVSICRISGIMLSA
jgi:hypothetical protein